MKSNEEFMIDHTRAVKGVHVADGSSTDAKKEYEAAKRKYQSLLKKQETLLKCIHLATY